MNTAPANLPAASDARAMQRYPDARNAERDRLIDCVTLFPGMTTLDIQSAAGYLTDEIWRRLDGKLDAICVEPSSVLRSRLRAEYRAVNNPVEDFQDVDSQTVDAVLGLAGLHHSESHNKTINESYRVLKPGGQFAICDVIEGSSVARWLNEFVHEHNPAGHKGNFISPGQVPAIMEEAGFTGITETEEYVPWVFDSRSDVVTFFKGLFDLECPANAIDRVLDDYFNCRETSGGYIVDWSLLYCSGQHP